MVSFNIPPAIDPNSARSLALPCNTRNLSLFCRQHTTALLPSPFVQGMLYYFCLKKLSSEIWPCPQ